MFLPGDLFFQQRGDTEVDDLVASISSGIGGRRINHVALYIGNDTLIEAVEPRVRSIGLRAFLREPRVVVLRLRDSYRNRIGPAVEKARDFIGLPYDRAYSRQPNAMYCSKLVIEAFRDENGTSIFSETSMTFVDPATGTIPRFWVDYYAKMGAPVPEGEPGSHPARLSLSECLEKLPHGITR